MTPAEIQERLGRLLGAAPECGGQGSDAFALVPAERWLEVARHLREGEGLEFDYLRSLTAVDRPAEDKLDIAAHLFSYKYRRALTLKTRLDRAAPRLASVGAVWPAAYWHERELWEMFGVEVENHPDLRHLLLPEDWQGFPLRKDYVMPEHYQGIPTRRPMPAAETATEVAKPGTFPKDLPEAS